MAGSHRTITPILIVQAATLVLATGGSIAWTITELRDWHSQVDVPQRTVRDIESHVQAAIIAPYNYLGTGDIRAQVKADKASAEAQASLRVLGNLVPDLKPQIESTHSSLLVLEDASAQLWDGHAAVNDAERPWGAPDHHFRQFWYLLDRNLTTFGSHLGQLGYLADQPSRSHLLC